MDEKAKKGMNKSRLALLLLALALLMLLAAAIIFTVRVGSRVYFCADTVDARAEAISRADYDRIAARRPRLSIRWGVPIGDERFDSFSEAIRISSLPEDDVDSFGYFPYLKTVDARGCEDYEALAAAAKEYGNLRFVWSVPSSAGPVNGDTGRLEAAGLSLSELERLLPLLPRLEEVDLRGSALSADQTDAFAAAHEELHTIYSVPVWGTEVPGDSTVLRLPAGASGDDEELFAAIERLPKLEKLDLRDCAITPIQLARLLPRCDGLETDYVIRLCGRVFTADCEEMDLSTAPVGDLEEIKAAVGLMPKLKKVVMCDCGVPDEEMDALDQSYENVRFVWTVYFSIYGLRTDATYFCISDVPQLNYLAPELTDEELYPLRYCRDLVALDIGHMPIRDLSFLYNMPHLKYLLIVGGFFKDITPIGSLKELEYLEMFQTTPKDISPLLNCKNLRHLNMCYCFGFDPSPLKEMTWLKRLWYAGAVLKEPLRSELPKDLPDTVCYFPYFDPDGSTGGGWREDEAYYEMRDVFGMYYQPGGTGVHN